MNSLTQLNESPKKHHREKSSTNKKIRTFFMLAIICSPLPIFYYYYLTDYLSTPVPEVAWVSWYDNPSNQVYIGWETAKLEQCIVKYGLSKNDLMNEIKEMREYRYHTVNLTGLTPNTTYFYRIEINGKIFTQGQFKTAPASADTFQFVLTSDTQQKFGPGWHSTLAKIIGKKNYAFVAMVGDIVEDGPKAEWYDYFTRASEFLDTTPLVPIRGNHDRPKDVNNDGKEEYYFPHYFPQSVDSVKNLNEYDTHYQFYYSFNWSNVHFQILHFPEVDIDDFDESDGINRKDYYQAFTADHLAWIKEDLKNAQSLPFRISLFHCPITSAGFYGPNHVLIDELLPILHKYNVTVTVHGHAHHYERGLLKNTIHPNNDLHYFLVGCGGGLADVGLRPVEETEVCLASPCFTEVTAMENKLIFKTISPDGTILDKYIINAVEES